ncbi:MAG: hypothetical protein Kow0042_14670 [Calditrichia bacterium]
MKILNLRILEVWIILLISVYSLFSQQTDKIGLVVHIIRYDDGSGGISLNTVDQAIADLNMTFSFLNAEFERYVTRYHNCSYYAEVSESDVEYLFSAYNIYADKAINVYFAPNPEFIVMGTLPPDRGALINEPYIGDGIVVENQYALTSTLPHEFGHLFGLFHIYETRTGIELPDGSNWWEAGDLLEDTPAEPVPDRGGANWANDCVHYLGKKFYQQGMAYDTVENRDNYMAASPRHCRNSFTNDQRNLMKYMYNSGERNYLKDVRWIQFTNKIGTLNAGGTFKIENHIFGSGEYYPCPSYAIDVETGQERLQTDYKHHDWNEVNENFRLIYKDFTATLTTQPQVANFIQMNSVAITTHNLHTGEMDVGKIQFKDPWYLHSDYTQPDDFFEYDDLPFYPTGSYYQTTGGVFWNQEPDPQNPDAPYYSLRAPSQQFVVNGKTLTYDLEEWTAEPASSAEFQHAYSETTPVIFRQDGAVVTANMKARASSDTRQATVGNNSRNLVYTFLASPHTTVPFIVYSDRGNIYTTRQNENGAWQKDSKRASASATVIHQHPAAYLPFYLSGDFSYDPFLAWDEYDTHRQNHTVRSNLGPFPGYDYVNPHKPHPAVAGYLISSRGEMHNRSGVIAFRGGNELHESFFEGLRLWFTRDNILVYFNQEPSADYPTLDVRKDPYLPWPYYMMAWQQNDGIHYVEFYRNQDQGSEVVYQNSAHLNQNYPYLSTHRKPSLHTMRYGNSDYIFVSWEAIEYVGPGYETRPVICVRRRGYQEWYPLEIYEVWDATDRNPVITAWENGEFFDYGVAYQQNYGQIRFFSRTPGGEVVEEVLTEDGNHPAITTIGEAPYVAWTEYEAPPYRVMVTQPELQ